MLLSWQYPYESEQVGPRLKDRCTSLSLLFRAGDGTVLLGAANPRDATRPDACEAIAAFLRNAPAESDDESP